MLTSRGILALFNKPTTQAMTHIQNIENTLLQIQTYLQQSGLWSDCPPTSQQLTSQAPFAIDTLAFEQWLQFIFLPQLRQYLTEHGSLPPAMDVAPMAQQVYEGEHTPLVHQLLVLDNLSKAEPFHG